MKQILTFIVLLVAILALAGTVYIGVQRVDRYLELKAIDDCAKDYTMTYDDPTTHTKVVRPLEQPFRQCVWNKGIKSWQGTN